LPDYHQQALPGGSRLPWLLCSGELQHTLHSSDTSYLKPSFTSDPCRSFQWTQNWWNVTRNTKLHCENCYVSSHRKPQDSQITSDLKSHLSYVKAKVWLAHSPVSSIPVVHSLGKVQQQVNIPPEHFQSLQETGDIPESFQWCPATGQGAMGTN